RRPLFRHPLPPPTRRSSDLVPVGARLPGVGSVPDRTVRAAAGLDLHQDRVADLCADRAPALRRGGVRLDRACAQPDLDPDLPGVSQQRSTSSAPTGGDRGVHHERRHRWDSPVWVPILIDMVSSMKTTIDIPDEVMRRVREVARQRGTTMRELMLEGLRNELERDVEEMPPTDFVFTAVDGDGRSPEIAADEVIDVAYGLPQ